MKPPFPAIVRIIWGLVLSICGLLLIIQAGWIYKDRAALGRPRLPEFGWDASGLLRLRAWEPWQITLSFSVIGLIGLVMLIAGVVTFLKTRR